MSDFRQALIITKAPGIERVIHFIRYDPAALKLKQSLITTTVMNRLPPLMAFSPALHICLSFYFPIQVIQTVSAVDKDDPIQGHYFDYRLVPEMLNNPNFTIKNNQGQN